jgi:hypothetical protein
MRRGHAHGTVLPVLEAALDDLRRQSQDPTLEPLAEMTRLMRGYLQNPPRTRPVEPALPDYVELAERHRGGRNRKKLRDLTT